MCKVFQSLMKYDSAAANNSPKCRPILALTCHVCIRQEKIPSGFLRFTKFFPNLVSMMVKEVLPMMVDLQPHPEPPPEPSKVYELNFKIPNCKSTTIFQNDLWFLYISR